MNRHVRIGRDIGIASSVCLFLASGSVVYGAQSWQDNMKSYFHLPVGARTAIGPERLDLRETRTTQY